MAGVQEDKKEQLGQASQLRLEAMRGTNRGEPIERLFCKLSKSVALHDGDPVYYHTVLEYLKNNYGFSELENELPLDQQMREFEERLEKLKKEFQKDEETETRDVLNRMRMAIREHEFAIKDLKEQLRLKSEI